MVSSSSSVLPSFLTLSVSWMRTMPCWMATWEVPVQIIIGQHRPRTRTSFLADVIVTAAVHCARMATITRAEARLALPAIVWLVDQVSCDGVLHHKYCLGVLRSDKD